MFNKKTIKDVTIKNQTVLVRVDYNVPKDGERITDDLRIRASLPTLKYLLDQKAAKIVLISHLGRPDGRRDNSLSLAPVAIRLQELLPEATVRFVADNIGPEVESAVKDLPTGGILLLENLRFSPEEEKNSEDFARDIVDSTHAELFVQDGFAVIHRAHASTDAITHFLPSVAGFLVEKEVETLTAASVNPTHPLLVIIGGAKVDDKKPLIDKFSDLADNIAIGGKIAADGYAPETANVYVASDFVEDPTGAKLDIGPDSTGHIVDLINESETIIWNGLTGKAEDPDFAASSTTIAEAIGQQPATKTTIIGGGDTAGFVENLKKSEPTLNYTLISTGGGASLELLSGDPLPGLLALEDK
jgi:phosphoglycerate kinase